MNVCQWLCMQRLLAIQAFNVVLHLKAPLSRWLKQKYAIQVKIWCLEHFVRDGVIGGRDGDAFAWNLRLPLSR